MSEYDDRSKYTDEWLLDNYKKCVASHQNNLDNGAQDSVYRIKAENTRAAILKRMRQSSDWIVFGYNGDTEFARRTVRQETQQSEAVKPEAGKNSNSPDYVVTIDDGFCIYRFELGGSDNYSIDDLISMITDKTELHIVEESVIYPKAQQESEAPYSDNESKPTNTSNDLPEEAICPTCGTAIGIEGEDEPKVGDVIGDITYGGRGKPFIAKDEEDESDAQKESEWEEVELIPEDIIKPDDQLHWTSWNRKSITFPVHISEWGKKIVDILGEYHGIQIDYVTRRVRKLPDRDTERAQTIAEKKLALAMKMLQKFADDNESTYASLQCDAQHALGEINALDQKAEE